MLSTYLSYQLIARDMPKAIDRVEREPMVDRETKYYIENISKVKTVEEFVGNDRLFRYAMKAHGLEDMAYAKAFMIKALKEGVSDPDSFANKLQDKRYAEFVSTYNFEKYGERRPASIARSMTRRRTSPRASPSERWRAASTSSRTRSATTSPTSLACSPLTS